MHNFSLNRILFTVSPQLLFIALWYVGYIAQVAYNYDTSQKTGDLELIIISLNFGSGVSYRMRWYPMRDSYLYVELEKYIHLFTIIKLNAHICSIHSVTSDYYNSGYSQDIYIIFNIYIYVCVCMCV